MARSFVRSFLSFERAHPRLFSMARGGCVLALMGVLVLESPVRSVAGPMVQSPEGWGNGGSVELVPPTPTIPAPCVPVDCKGIARPRAYDVNRDCTVSIKDSDAITKFLNSRSPSSRVTAQNEHLDANSDGWVDPQDVLAIIDALNESECIAPPPTQIPQPTNTQTPMPTASSTATITATPTGTATATATDTPLAVACQAYQLSVVHEGDMGRAKSGFWHLSEAGQKLRSCLGALIDTKQSLESVDQSIARTENFGDDYAIGAITGGAWYLQGGTFSSSLLNTSYKPSPYVTCNERHATLGVICVSGQVYFDAQCNRVPLNNLPAQICDAGHVAWRASPISLNFADQSTLAKDVKFTQFPLLPGTSERWFAWKASADHPVLVIDPAHKGEILSAYQLFGSWSFGGSDRSLNTMLPSSALPAKETKPWRHGFEALATLDANKDGSIAGTELAPLGLWFDANRNGVSEQGEVKTVAQAGVTSLFYKDPQYDGVLDGYRLGLGFERMVDGKRVIGSSFDWFSPGDTSKERLISSELTMQMRDVHGDRPKEVAEDFLPDSPVDRRATINGAWEWVSDLDQNPNEPTIGGILSFTAFENGDVRGVTISESHYAQPYPLNSVVHFNAFKGTQGSPDSVTFTVESAQWKLRSTGKLSSDGATLAGETTATMTDDTKSFSYTWKAKKRG